MVVTAVAPVVWGANYVVTRTWLPADFPLWGSALRALPAGLLLLAVARTAPSGSWWWRSAVLGSLNVAAFFLLVYVAAQLLPSGVAASIMALSPLALAGAGWLVLREALTARLVLTAVAGVVGVLLLLGGAAGGLSPGGVVASLGALTLNAFGSTLAKRWKDQTPVLCTTAWQLTFGGIVLTVIAVGVEGAPPDPTLSALAALIFSTLIATALAFLCWFAGLAHLRASVVGVIGLLNPISGAVLGALVAHEFLTGTQVLGLVVALAGIATAARARPAGPQNDVGFDRSDRHPPPRPSVASPGGFLNVEKVVRPRR